MSNGTMVSLIISAAMLLTPLPVMAASNDASADAGNECAGNCHESKRMGIASPDFGPGSFRSDSASCFGIGAGFDTGSGFDLGSGHGLYSTKRTDPGSSSGYGSDFGPGSGSDTNLGSGDYTELDPDGDGDFGPVFGSSTDDDSGSNVLMDGSNRSLDQKYSIVRDEDGEIVGVDLSHQGLTSNAKIRQKLNELGVANDSLRSLDLSHNGLSGTLDLSGLYNLWFVDCSNNRLSSVVMKKAEDRYCAQPYGLDCSNNEILWLPGGLVKEHSDWEEIRQNMLEDEEAEWVNKIPAFDHDFSGQSVSLSVHSDGDTFDLHTEVPGMIMSNFTLAGASSDFVHTEFYSGQRQFRYAENLVAGKAPMEITGMLTVNRIGSKPAKPVDEDNQDKPLLPTDIVDPLDPAIPGEITALQQNAGSANAYRLYNPNSGEHFYTEALKERDYLIRVGWRDEGVGWIAPKLSTVPVYRLYNQNAGDHHYTVSVNERDELKRLGWKDEGIGWYSDEGKSVPLLRQYNPNAKAGSHNYTPDEVENDYLVKVGWRPEGIAWYGLPGSERN
ncbi:leucine-rich repeat domain-containing protein [Erysipelotrichaceae bacterium RD49]|nr:leucine-rich repeat domain-containing protein [Erysipelotrichaceae bacterium RD49]